MGKGDVTTAIRPLGLRYPDTIAPIRRIALHFASGESLYLGAALLLFVVVAPTIAAAPLRTEAMPDMKAIVCTKYGPPEVLQLKELNKPQPSHDQVRIRVRTTAVTSSD